MTDVDKTELFRSLGYGGEDPLLEAALEEAGLSRPEKGRISNDKTEEVARVLAERFFPVCSRGDCQAAAPELAEGLVIVPAASQDDCAVCGGSANRRAVDEMVAALAAAGLRRLCVVGGSPVTREELAKLVAGRVELRLVDGVGRRTKRDAAADLSWADLVVLWGGTILAHRVSRLYGGARVVSLASRSIQQVARRVVRALAERQKGWEPGAPGDVTGS